MTGEKCTHFDFLKCECLKIFTDYDCGTIVDHPISLCMNRGTLESNRYTSSRLPGWTGVHCETNVDCNSNPCQNNASCYNDNITNFVCYCQPGWTGILCETNQENPEIVVCPMNITVNTTNGEPVAINVTWTEPTATNNSGETPKSDYTSGDNMFVIGGTTVQYNVSDSSGNFKDSCSFTVTVEVS
ncbi:sushi, von Willebrand factor type A, EGF and pentraxin domain-containing protein 1-like [Anneissia japonica]|uniref:sushi, von Willebrand factor type A, EGF and pentraxin domain-containing protein 1-like n=1 Tax=Anneissia japonica TaxID=1529436 RepID=UPI0014258E03|nr:sushi, von Willebrand factor type A, EGF and pentraxin domain-containing protein 1-like [Anneissia japonica]